jgi:hypothetical protein
MTRPEARLRVDRLIALALNPGAAEGEARNAAVAACRLIQEFSLLESLTPHLRPTASETASKMDSPVPPITVVNAKIITSRFASSCKVCRASIRAGERIWWGKKTGSVHLRCAHKTEV